MCRSGWFTPRTFNTYFTVVHVDVFESTINEPVQLTREKNKKNNTSVRRPTVAFRWSTSVAKDFGEVERLRQRLSNVSTRQEPLDVGSDRSPFQQFDIYVFVCP